MNISSRHYYDFKCRYGYFSQDGYEYLITRPDTPSPWVNIISNGDFGLVVSQAGGGFTWRTHVDLNRLTRWNQDLIRDDWGKWLYLRDRDTNALRSLAFQPMQAKYETYLVRHGLGYTTFLQQANNLETEWTLFAAKDDPVEIWICTIRNLSEMLRRLRLMTYFEWCLGAPDAHREFHKLFIETRYQPSIRTILATKTLWDVPTDKGHWNTEWPYLGFHAVNHEVSGWDTSKEKLLGRHGNFQNPVGIRKGVFTETQGLFQEAAASLATDINLEPGEEKTVIFLIGQVDHNTSESGMEKVQSLIERYSDEKIARFELEKVKSFWRELTDRVHIQTPEDAFDLLSNIWLKYQAISAHLWARTGYYQQSGAYGFRDQLQSSQIWLPHESERMLEQVKLHARHQFKNGTVLHWWHPLTETGLSTDMTDDLLWLPFMLMRYFQEVGNCSALAETVPFFDGEEASLQEHCIRAIHMALNRFSERGLPFIGAGDWCDGFSAVGLNWKGESIWLGMFLCAILTGWSEILALHSPFPDPGLAEEYKTRAAKLKEAINTHAWNGEWYIAATTDDGTVLGDPSQEACKIYLNTQTWAIISAVADGERRKQIIQAIVNHLEGDNGFMLFHPAFKKPNKDIGYITRYAPGVRENAGVYMHAATWSVLALAMEDRPEDALRIFRKLNPILQSEKDADRYRAEPYVLPGNIEGKDSDFYGRAGWTWYTGSAGWLFTIALEAICGLRPVFSGLQVAPCIPEGWQDVRVVRPFRGAIFHVLIENPNRGTGNVQELFINGKRIPGNIIPPQRSGHHEVRAVLSGN